MPFPKKRKKQSSTQANIHVPLTCTERAIFPLPAALTAVAVYIPASDLVKVLTVTLRRFGSNTYFAEEARIAFVGPVHVTFKIIIKSTQEIVRKEKVQGNNRQHREFFEFEILRNCLTVCAENAERKKTICAVAPALYWLFTSFLWASLRELTQLVKEGGTLCVKAFQGLVHMQKRVTKVLSRDPEFQS